MINNSYINVPLRAQIKGYYVGETQAGYPFLAINLRVIDNSAREILNDREGSFFGPVARYYLVSSKTGRTNAFAVNSLRHLFPAWDDSLEWFGGNPHVDEWFSCLLKVNQDGNGYDVEALYPFNGQPYKSDRPDVSELAKKWDQYFKAVPRPEPAAPAPKLQAAPVVMNKNLKKTEEGDDVPF